MYYLISSHLVPVPLDMYIGFYGGHDHKLSIKEKKDNYKLFNKYSDPKNISFIKFIDGNEVLIAYHYYDVGHFVIKSKSRKEAYHISNLICGYLSLSAIGVENNDINLLVEIDDIPNFSMEDIDLLRIINNKMHSNWKLEDVELLSAGIYVLHEELMKLQKVLHNIYNNIILADCFTHFIQSLRILNGNMSISFYYSHYQYEILDVTNEIREKSYFEYRTLYEAAFTCAFKGIERFFNVNDIKYNDVKNIISNCKIKEIETNPNYTRNFERYIGLPIETNYEEILKHFVNLRNICGAHANKMPPLDKFIYFDNVFEIQCFLKCLIYDLISEYNDCTQ
ncbi:MAG: hypothetical protein KBH06_07570 [Spirochaetes bacterium]|nr:hypothetical protein [Spirochaetota bacterium]MBP9023043.1 hypothetical protein [Spirochaetota bacterium]